VRRAVDLSPTVPGVSLDAATFYERISYGDAFEYLLSGLSGFFVHPVALVYVSSYGIIALLSAVTLALFVVCVAQLVVRSRRLIYAFANALPVKWRALGSPLLMLAVMMGPLLAGVFVAIGVWGLVLSRYLRGCRWLGVTASAVVLFWGVTLPIIQRANLNAYQPVNVAVENVLTQTYAASNEQYLEKIVAKSRTPRIYLYAVAQSFFHHRDYNQARQYFNLVVASQPSRLDQMGMAALTALGAVEFRSGNYRQAKQLFERAEEQGAREFAVYYNLALTHLALVDPTGHQKYYQLAREADPERALALESAQQLGAENDVLWSAYPTWSFLGSLLQPIAGLEQAELHATGRQLAIYHTLFPSSNWFWVLAWGAFVGIFGAANLLKFERRKSRIELTRESRSLTWSIVPAGFLAVGERPLLAVGAMSLLFVLVIIGLGEPKWGLKGVAPVIMMQGMALWLAVFCCLALSVAGVLRELGNAKGRLA